MDDILRGFNVFFTSWWGILITVFVGLALITLLYKPFFKRFFDILLSGIAMIVFSPVYLILYILIKTKLGSPVMFRQYRPGKRQKIFRLHKFRTMTEERDENGELLPDEIRLTKFGRLLRNTSLDELPELWDIFRGKMSIIGPRPHLVRDMVYMTDEENRRHDVRPGLTGLAQVRGRNHQSWEERFKYDLEYVDRINIWNDIKIFFLTIKIVFVREGIDSEGMVGPLHYGDYLLDSGKVTQEEFEEKEAEAKRLLSAVTDKKKKAAAK